MRPKHPLLQKCLTYLEKLPHVQVETEVGAMPYVEDVLADGKITIRTPQGAATYIAVIRSDTTIETLSFVVEYINHLKQKLTEERRPLLIADNFSKLTQKELIRADIEFIDTAGDCYLNSHALYLLTSNTPLTTEKTPKSLEITPSILQLMYVLLRTQQPDIPKYFFGQLAHFAGIPQRSVESFLDRLCRLNYLQRQPKSGYQIINHKKLLERWELGYAESLRSKLFIGTYAPSSGKRFSDIEAQIIDRAEDEQYLIGGELGGALATKYLSPIGATLHLPEDKNPTPLCLQLKLKPDSRGTITFLRQFGNNSNEWIWENPPAPMLADPLLIHAEMMTLATDERIRETSDRLFEQHLNHLFEQYLSVEAF